LFTGRLTLGSIAGLGILRRGASLVLRCELHLALAAVQFLRLPGRGLLA
jgi:hypothetical protein